MILSTSLTDHIPFLYNIRSLGVDLSHCLQLAPQVNFTLPSLNLLGYFRGFDVNQYLLGSPMVLSTVLEIHCAPVCYSTERVYNLMDLQPGKTLKLQ